MPFPAFWEPLERKCYNFNAYERFNLRDLNCVWRYFEGISHDVRIPFDVKAAMLVMANILICLFGERVLCSCQHFPALAKTDYDCSCYCKM